MLLVAYLDHLHSEFQLQRLLSQHSSMASNALLDISLRLLATAMVVTSRDIDTLGMRRDRAWIVSG